MGYKYYSICLLLYIAGLVLDAAAITLCIVQNVRLYITTLFLLLFLYMAYRLYKLLRYPHDIIDMFLLSLRCGDRTMRMPSTNDRYMGALQKNINSIIQLYQKNKNETEIKKNLYDNILRTMTHEMRNTLTPIISLSDYYVKNCDNTTPADDIKNGLTIINSQSKSLKKFLDSYHTFIELPHPEIEKIHIPELFGHIEQLLRNEPGADKIKIFYTNISVHADQVQLRQLLVNILHNALYAIQGYDDGEIELRATQSEKHTVITVTDNGCGIPQTKIEDIFTPFYTTRHDGTGIGLSLCRQIMMLHGGDITVESNPDSRYTSFSMTFPFYFM